MTETLNEKHYILVCEIGPIVEYTRQSRKTIDFWGASFIFSYIMSEVAIKLEGDIKDIFLPFLEDNPMYKRDDTPIHCGSVPDRLFFVVTDDQKKKLTETLPGIIAEITEPVEKQIWNAIREEPPISSVGIKSFFNFFYIFQPLEQEAPSHNEFLEAEQKISMRASSRPFQQHSKSKEIKKWEKCNLCGERVLVTTVIIDKCNNLFDEERICEICALRRYLPEAIKPIVSDIVKPAYDSTSDIAAQPITSSIQFLNSLHGHDSFKTTLNNSVVTLKSEYRKLMELNSRVNSIK